MALWLTEIESNHSKPSRNLLTSRIQHQTPKPTLQYFSIRISQRFLIGKQHYHLECLLPYLFSHFFALSAFPIATTALLANSLVSPLSSSLTENISILFSQRLHLSLLNPVFPFHNTLSLYQSVSISPQRLVIFFPWSSMIRLQ
jgi:hypothetical protein